MVLPLSAGVSTQGVTPAALSAAVPRLRPPPHRMEPCGATPDGISFIDDSKATNVESALAGLSGMPGGRTAVVLLGGLAKEGVAGACAGGDGFPPGPLCVSADVRALCPSLTRRHAAIAGPGGGLGFGRLAPTLKKQARFCSHALLSHQTTPSLLSLRPRRHPLAPNHRSSALDKCCTPAHVCVDRISRWCLFVASGQGGGGVRGGRAANSR